MTKRTEEDKVTQASIVVILGGKDYEIAPQVIRDSRVWRKKLITLIAPLPELANATVDTSDPAGFETILTKLMVTMPDDVIDLFFEYAKDLPRDVIEATATDAEMATAFAEVVKIAFPLVEAPVRTMAKLYQ